MCIDEIARVVKAREIKPITVPITALYSLTDSVVCPGACIDHLTPGVEHIALPCTHAGFAFHPQVYALIAQRLALHS